MKDIVLSDSSDEIENTVLELEKNEDNVYQQLSVIDQYILGEEGHALERNARKLFIEWKPIRNKVFQHLEYGDRKKAVSVTKQEGAEHVEKLENQAITMTEYAANKASEILSRAENEQKLLKYKIVILSFASVLASIVISFIATKFALKAERKLSEKNIQLQKALNEVKTLSGFLPICSYCKKIRDDNGEWEVIEDYIHKNSGAQFSHGACPECYEKEMNGLRKIIESIKPETESCADSDPI